MAEVSFALLRPIRFYEVEKIFCPVFFLFIHPEILNATPLPPKMRRRVHSRCISIDRIPP